MGKRRKHSRKASGRHSGPDVERGMALGEGEGSPRPSRELTEVIGR